MHVSNCKNGLCSQMSLFQPLSEGLPETIKLLSQ